MKEVFDITTGTEIIGAKDDLAENLCRNKLLHDKIENRKFSGDVEIDHCETDSKKLRFENCIFDNIIIKNGSSGQIEELKFIGCKINSVEFFRCSINAVFETSQIISAKFDDCKMPKIKIESCDVQSISFGSKGSAEELFISRKCNIEKIECKDVRIGFKSAP